MDTTPESVAPSKPRAEADSVSVGNDCRHSVLRRYRLGDDAVIFTRALRLALGHGVVCGEIFTDIVADFFDKRIRKPFP